MALHNKRMQPDFGELALASAADAGVIDLEPQSYGR
jgi:hypothetical protein